MLARSSAAPTGRSGCDALPDDWTHLHSPAASIAVRTCIMGVIRPTRAKYRAAPAFRKRRRRPEEARDQGGSAFTCPQAGPAGTITGSKRQPPVACAGRLAGGRGTGAGGIRVGAAMTGRRPARSGRASGADHEGQPHGHKNAARTTDPRVAGRGASRHDACPRRGNVARPGSTVLPPGWGPGTAPFVQPPGCAVAPRPRDPASRAPAPPSGNRAAIYGGRTKEATWTPGDQ